VQDDSASPALAEFERIYRGNVGVVTRYFARRCGDAQMVADLTSETIVRAAAGVAGFDPGRGSARVAVGDRRPRVRPVLRPGVEWPGCHRQVGWSGRAFGG
jgi:hypothetical protein